MIDTTRNAIVGRLTVGKTPSGVAVSPDGGKIVVANAQSQSVSVIVPNVSPTAATLRT